ncbi:DUF6445 family protein [Pseudoalteromonas sp. SWXJZ10B]|uniref:DUF6445 family protein n=1 Tax=Pseudoalteromonas sp. SWXJZ10B TaxID=2792063 RepID=UPI0018CFEDB3|nr:DUF6445 family protein [Pseudoalteromonas sp. SWXJZ10B]MBH0043421.1 hypothetical protein [Pseudoalteromonas sp. SWXJZ10B]
MSFKHQKVPKSVVLPSVPSNAPGLRYEKPELGSNYWVVDEFFKHEEAMAIRSSCLKKEVWKYGKPYTKELWPGMRTPNALNSKQLKKIEKYVKSVIKKNKLWVADSNKVVVDTNTAILVGAEEGASRPHVDNRYLCRYAAVLYLNPDPITSAGTSFYRLKYANEAAGGNIVDPPYANLVDALNVSSLPYSAWYKDIDIENRFNRLIIFKGSIVHSASEYFGDDLNTKRLAITFFWMCED